MNSRAKGKAGELEFSHYLTALLGCRFRRGQQFHGGAEAPDVIADDPALKAIHWEVKRVESLNLREAMAQAVRDASVTQVPVVAHRRNRGEWLFTFRADDLLRLMDVLEPSVAANHAEGLRDVGKGGIVARPGAGGVARAPLSYPGKPGEVEGSPTDVFPQNRENPPR